jgi:hypothetical protein
MRIFFVVAPDPAALIAAVAIVSIPWTRSMVTGILLHDGGFFKRLADRVSDSFGATN